MLKSKKNSTFKLNLNSFNFNYEKLQKMLIEGNFQLERHLFVNHITHLLKTRKRLH